MCLMQRPLRHWVWQSAVKQEALPSPTRPPQARWSHRPWRGFLIYPSPRFSFRRPVSSRETLSPYQLVLLLSVPRVSDI